MKHGTFVCVRTHQVCWWVCKSIGRRWVRMHLHDFKLGVPLNTLFVLGYQKHAWIGVTDCHTRLEDTQHGMLKHASHPQTPTAQHAFQRTMQQRNTSSNIYARLQPNFAHHTFNSLSTHTFNSLSTLSYIHWQLLASFPLLSCHFLLVAHRA